MAWLRDMLSLNLYDSSVTDIADQIQKLSETKKTEVISICEKVLNRSEIAYRKNDTSRISIIQVLVASAPRSKHVIERLIANTYGRKAYEIQFTLFCILDELNNLPEGRELRSFVLDWVGNYLIRVKHDTAHAAWMAGDMLGHHWPLKQSLPILIKVTKEAKFVSGREAAVDGLGKALKRVGKSSRHHKQILTLLQQVSISDRSENLRQWTQYILGKSPLQRRG
jgi:hypothetical protein